MADARLPALPWASRPAVAYPPTGRVVRRKLISQAVFLLLVWPVLIAGSILLAVDDHRFIPLMARILAALIVVPVNAWGAVSALRMHRVLSEHAWRLVECDVVAPVSHAWRLKEYESPTGRGVRVPAVHAPSGWRATRVPARPRKAVVVVRWSG